MNKVRQARLNSGLKVKKIAELLSIGRSHYYNLEIGNTKITEDKAEILAKVINLDKEIILKELGEVNNERFRRTSN